jgi:hypothetical protein
MEARIDELEALMRAANYAEAETLPPQITKFTSVLTEEQRDFVNAVKAAVKDSVDWTARDL